MRRLKKEQRIGVKTLYGELLPGRGYYYCRHCHHGEVPFDERMGIDELAHRMSDAMRGEVAFFGQNQQSFERASEMIERVFDMYISDETVRVVAEEVGAMEFEARKKAAEAAIEHMNINCEAAGEQETAKTLYIMTDGAAVNTRVEDENGSTWRENKLVMAFTDRDIEVRQGKGGERRGIVGKSYNALIGSSEQFKGFMLDTALKAGYGSVSEVVVIADGAAWIRNACEEIFPDAVQILDLFHLKEKVYDYGKVIFGQDAAQYTPWAEMVISLLESGNASGALEAIDAKGKNESINLRSYIENNRDKINYPEYKEKGWFVGSGAIESANKLILQSRLKQAGMRWSVSGAQAILSLRCKFESKRRRLFVHRAA